MENIFESLIKNMPKKPSGAAQVNGRQPADGGQKAGVAPAVRGAAGETLQDIIKRWQADGNQEDAAKILLKMQPTIHSAMTSFARGQDSRLSVPAAKITLDALKSYDPSKAAPQTFVFNNLKRLSRINAQRGNIIHMPEDESRARRYLAELTNRFQDEHGREPSAGELADLSGYNTKKVDRLLSSAPVTSTSSALTDDTRREVGGSRDIGDSDYYEYVYASCDPVNQKIMDWTAGAHGKPMLSNAEIAAKLKITPAAVSQRRVKIQALMSDARGLL